MSTTDLDAGADALLAALDEEQRAVATALTGPVCVLAGAGTGKTRAITHRIAYGVRTGTYNPQAVLAVTFTARAAGEMRARLRALGAAGVQARTFHAAALRQLAYFLPKVERRAVPRLIDHKAASVAQAAASLGLEVDRATVRDLAAEIEWSKVNIWTAEDYRLKAERAGRGPVAGYDVTTVSRLIQAYNDVLAGTESMDFEDVLLAMCGLMASHPQVAEEIRRQYRHFVVDEYQDVSPLQQRLLNLWLGPRQEICVVGDPNQTIYTFTGASADHLLEFTSIYPQSEVVTLVRDYRSTPQVVSLANSVVRLSRRRGQRARWDFDLVAQQPSGPAPRFEVFADDVAEAQGVTARIAGLHRQGLSWAQIAILFRTNSQSQAFEQALADADIPYLVRGGERYFSRSEVRQAMLLLRGAARAEGSGDLGRDVRDVLASIGWSLEPPKERGAIRERWESLQALAALADESAATMGTMAQFVAMLEERAAAQHAPEAAGVTLASLHAAKGLEWDAVFLVGLSEGLLPISLAEGEQIAEERRLLYVGITRARTHLMLSYARARTPGGKASREVSRFLTPLWPAEPTRGRSRSRSTEPLAEDEQRIYDLLTAWRSQTAAAAGRPDFTVLHDSSLEHMARSRPRSVPELARIPGIGAMKLQAYATGLLEVLASAETDPGKENPKKA